MVIHKKPTIKEAEISLFLEAAPSPSIRTIMPTRYYREKQYQKNTRQMTVLCQVWDGKAREGLIVGKFLKSAFGDFFLFQGATSVHANVKRPHEQGRKEKRLPPVCYWKINPTIATFF